MNYVRREGSVQSNHTKRMRRNNATRMEMEVYNGEMEVEWKWKLNENMEMDGPKQPSYNKDHQPSWTPWGSA